MLVGVLCEVVTAVGEQEREEADTHRVLNNGGGILLARFGAPGPLVHKISM